MFNVKCSICMPYVFLKLQLLSSNLITQYTLTADTLGQLTSAYMSYTTERVYFHIYFVNENQILSDMKLLIWNHCIKIMLSAWNFYLLFEKSTLKLHRHVYNWLDASLCILNTSFIASQEHFKKQETELSWNSGATKNMLG